MRKLFFLIILLSINTFAQNFSSSPGANITDNGQNCYPITVSGVGTINSIYELQSVCIDITHTWDADLDIYLLAPDGTSVELTTDNGGSGNNYSGTCFTLDALNDVTAGSAPFSGDYIPEGTLNNVNNGQNADGDWNLCITDDASGDDGTFNSWNLSFGTGCKWSMALVDTYGDGWNGGGAIEIIVNGVNFGQAWVNAGDGIYNGSRIEFDLDVNNGDIVQINFISGSWNSEDEYYIYDQNGTLIHSEGTGGTVPGNYIFAVTTCSKPLFTTGDCEGAIKVCSGSYSYNNSAYGDGAYEEIAGARACYGATISYGETAFPKGESNSTWYIFEVQTGGNFEFSVNQNVSGDDYDWVLYDITNNTCSDIVNGTISSVKCNWDISSSSTGMSSTTTGSGWETELAVNALEKYALVIDNWSSNGSGYTLNLNDGTAVIFDNVSPSLAGVTAARYDTIYFDFSENVSCASVSTTDFTVDGPDAPYTILEVGSVECSAGATTSASYWLRVSPSLVDGASYTLTLVGSVDDQCTNPTINNDGTFLPVELVSFDYKCLDNHAELEWTTLSEINNDYFSIYSSNNGGQWELISTINGSGNTNYSSNYKLSLNIEDKEKYYKLTQTDFDGTVEKLGIIYVSCEKFTPSNRISLYPNPSNEGTIVTIDGEYNSIEIYNSLGQIIHSNINNNQITDLAKGLYFVRFDNDKPIKLIIQ